MSLEKIGNMEHNMNIQRKPVIHREQRPEDVHDAFVHDTGKDLTKISNPPFLPIGDTQSIYRK